MVATCARREMGARNVILALSAGLAALGAGLKYGAAELRTVKLRS